MSITLNGTTGITTPDLTSAAPMDVGGSAVLTAASSLVAANLTGALQAISGAALTGIATGMVYDLLGTIATTSGSSATLSGLVLTSYKQIQFVFEGVSNDVLNSYLWLNGWRVAQSNYLATGDYCTGFGFIDLTTGVFGSCSASRWNGVDSGTTSAGGGYSGVTTASTSITFTPNTGSFDSGSIKIYGVA